MKLSFSTVNIAKGSFTSICDTACSYGFNGFEIYDIEYFEYEEDSFFQNDIHLVVIKKEPKDFAYSECAKRILVAEYNLNKAKYAIDNIGLMF